MRFSTMALTASLMLAAAGTTFAAPRNTPAHSADAQLCHEYLRANHSGTGSLHAGTTLEPLVAAAGCDDTKDAQCVAKYCYGDAAAQKSDSGEAFSLDQ